MRSPTRLILLILLVAGTVSSAEQPLVDVRIAPADQIAAHFHISPLGMVWNDPAESPLRELLANQFTSNDGKQLAQALAIIAAERGVQGRLFGLVPIPHHESVQADLIADLGDQAQAIMDLLKHQLPADAVPVVLAGTDEAMSLPHGVDVARSGSIIAFSSGVAPSLILPPIPPGPDVSVDLDLHALISLGLSLDKVLAHDPTLGAFIKQFGRLTMTLTLDHSGAATTFMATMPTAGLIPLSRTTLAEMPADSLELSAYGFDGTAWYQAWGPPLWALANDEMKQHGIADDAEKETDGWLKLQGLPTAADIIGSIHGTVCMATTPGIPMPSFTLVLPRTKALEAIVDTLLAKTGMARPVPGTPVTLTIPNLTIMPQLLVSGHDILVTTDQVLASQWPSSGWDATAVGKVALAHVDARTVGLGSGDTAAELHMATNFLGMALGSLPLNPAQKQAVMTGLVKLSTTSEPAWSASRVNGPMLESRSEGFNNVTTAGALAIVAAIAVPMVVVHRNGAAEDAVSAALQSSILPAEVRFKAKAYVDSAGQGAGEYGYISELSGQAKVAGPKGLDVLPPDFKSDTDPIVQGYRYRVYLPSGPSSAQTDPYPAPRHDDPASATLRQRYWVAYAWPAVGHEGEMFAIDQRGKVWKAPFAGVAPSWNALYGDGASWTTAHPVWTR